jgi:hypothetical protein
VEALYGAGDPDRAVEILASSAELAGRDERLEYLRARMSGAGRPEPRRYRA